MKAVGFNRPLPITQTESLQDIELPVPEYGEQDLLVEVQAIAVNPADHLAKRKEQNNEE